MSDWDFLNKCRIPPGKDAKYGTRPADGFNGAFYTKINGVEILILASDGMGWQHVSVSLAHQPNHTPSWSIMCQVKDLFWEEEDAVMQIHPPKSQYVNQHPGCLHLWRPTDAGVEIPLPYAAMLGTQTTDGKDTFAEPRFRKIYKPEPPPKKDEPEN